MSSYETMVIFSIDFSERLNRRILFWEHLRELGLDKRVQPCTGKYKGQLEDSWIAPLSVFKQIDHKEWLQAQESFLHVSGCNKQYAVLHYQDGRPVEGLGSMVRLPEEIAQTYPNWTRRDDIGAYYVALNMNPDHWREVGPYEPEEMQSMQPEDQAA